MACLKVIGQRVLTLEDEGMRRTLAKMFPRLARMGTAYLVIQLLESWLRSLKDE